jgi:hypothetical protein
LNVAAHAAKLARGRHWFCGLIGHFKGGRRVIARLLAAGDR